EMGGSFEVKVSWSALINSSNDESDVEDDVDVVTIVDVVDAGKGVERGTGIDAKDGIMGKGGIDVDKIVESNEVDVISDGVDGIGNEVDIGVESMVDVELGGNGCFINVSRGKNDMFENGFDLVFVDARMDVEADVGMIDMVVGISVNRLVYVGIISKEVDVIVDEEGEVVDG
ncbi:hypothetical protein KI387_040431, partial [Taxus chinensis]